MPQNTQPRVADGTSGQSSGEPRSWGSSAAPVSEVPCLIKVKSWESVALWSWATGAETCAICKAALSQVCIECQTRSSAGASANLTVLAKKGTPLAAAGGVPDVARAETHEGPPNASLTSGTGTPSGRCEISWGSCGHVFHAHCLERWLPLRAACPLCNKPWELRQVTFNE